MLDRIKEVSEYPKVRLKQESGTVRTWFDAAEELESFLESVFNEPLDKELLDARWKDMKYLEDVHRMYVSGNENKIGLVLRFKLYLHNNYPRLFILLGKVKRMIKKENGQQYEVDNH